MRSLFILIPILIPCTPYFTMSFMSFNHKGLFYPPLELPTFSRVIDTHNDSDQLLSMIQNHPHPYKVIIRCFQCDVKFTFSTYPGDTFFISNVKGILLPNVSSESPSEQIHRSLKYLNLKGCHTVTMLYICDP